MNFDIEKFIIIDNHAHSLLKNFRELDEIGFRRCFTESRSLSMLQEHVQKSLHYINMIACLNELLNTRSESEVLSLRMREPAANYVQWLWDEVCFGGMVIDDGFAAGDTMSLDELSRVSGRPIYHCKRVEPLMETCFAEAESFAELCKNYRKKIVPQAKGRQSVSLKTICAYRGGLELTRPSEAEAKSDFEKQKKAAANAKKVRITKSPLYHYLLMQTFEMAAEAALPVQVHTGIGDDDADLLASNPALLQDLMRSRSLSKMTLVLLHCYPFVKEAAFMCSLYGNVYMDLSLSVSLASAAAPRMIADALCLAPSTKLLAGSDGHTSPESHFYGAYSWKRGLHACMGDLVESRFVSDKDAEEICANILHDNAIRIYKLEGLA